MGRSLDSLPGRLQQTVEEELRTDETPVWVGQPLRRRFARLATPMLVLGLLAVVAQVLWVRHVRRTGFGLDMALWAIPFAALTLAMLLSPLWFMHSAKRTAYVVTDQRAIIFLGGVVRSVYSFRPSRLRRIRLYPRPDGSGDIVFTYLIWYAQGGTTLVPRMDNGFYGITDLSGAEKAIRKLARKPPTR